MNLTQVFDVNNIWILSIMDGAMNNVDFGQPAFFNWESTFLYSDTLYAPEVGPGCHDEPPFAYTYINTLYLIFAITVLKLQGLF